MGVTIDIWRGRIGTYCSRAVSDRPVVSNCKAFTWTNSMIDAAFHFLICMICLLIGNIESNPGPDVFKCLRCQKQFPSIFVCASHEQIHSAEKNFIYFCPSSLCAMSFKSFSGLSAHLNTFHRQEKCPTTVSEERYRIQCQVPNCQFLVDTVPELCRHYIYIHADAGHATPCPLVQTCKSKTLFTKAQNLKSHLSIKHTGWTGSCSLKDVFMVKVAEQDEHPSCSYQPQDSGSQEHSMEVDDEFDEDNCSFFTNDVYLSHIAKFYLMLEAECMLPESTIQTICEGLTLLSELIQYQTRTVLTQVSKEEGISETQIGKIVNSVLLSDVFYAAHHKSSPGASLTSNHLRLKYFEEHFKFVVPQSCPLDEDTVDGEHVFFVSVKQTLEHLFEDPSIQEEVENSFKRVPHSDVIHDYYNGSVCCGENSSTSNKRIDLILFQDAFGVTNVVGSAKHKHKLNGTYWQLGNLRPHNRSKTDSIYLAFLVYEKLLKDRVNYGPAKCFEPLINELKSLEIEGILFKGETVQVKVQFIVGDNLGSHMLGGFTESFSGIYFCRFCEITRNQFHEDPTRVKAFRTVQDYCDALTKLDSAGAEIKSIKGIKEDSCFNKLSNFHVCDPRLPVCLAHDLFEGVVDWDLSAIISLLVKLGWFTYDLLNKRIQHFVCTGSDVGNRPASVRTDGQKLGGHAVQNWTLLRLLPLIIGDKVKDTKHEVWQLYLTLKKLVEYACAPAFTADDIADFKGLARDYILARSKIIPQQVKPKHHFLMHYADLVSRVGPLIYLFTLRFEAKHQFFKRIALACKNFINLGQTLARRHQLYFSYLRTGLILPPDIGVSKTRLLNLEACDERVRRALLLQGIEDSSQECDSIELDGLTFKRGLHISLKSDDSARIGCICMIVKNGANVFFLLEKFQAEAWDDYGLYKINQSSSFLECVRFSSLKYPICIQPVYDFKEEQCFSSKHFL